MEQCQVEKKISSTFLRVSGWDSVSYTDQNRLLREKLEIFDMCITQRSYPDISILKWCFELGFIYHFMLKQRKST